MYRQYLQSLNAAEQPALRVLSVFMGFGCIADHWSSLQDKSTCIAMSELKLTKPAPNFKVTAIVDGDFK
jgi:hypothetical protein